VSATWTVVVVVGLATAAIKAAGPLILGGRPLPPRLASVIALLAPALLAALVAINTVTAGKNVVIDARLAGVAVAAVAIRLKAPVLVVVVLAAGVTAGIRAIWG
jgi:hypothetical protein